MRVEMRKTRIEFLARECELRVTKVIYKDEYVVSRWKRGSFVKKGTFNEIEKFILGAVTFKRTVLASL